MEVAPAADAARPLVTVVTVVRNGVDTIERTLRSVEAQTYAPIEHWVIDGVSTDGTLAVLERHAPRVRWTSEPDAGLYDAMNKGVARVHDPDSYLLFLNADDALRDPDVVARLVAQGGGADAVYGRLERFDQETNYRDVIGREVTSRDMLFGMRCHHQALFARRRLFDRLGGFDLQYRLAADYDWVVRLFLDPGVTRRFVPVVVSTMRRGGVSDRRYLESVAERHRIVRRHYSRADAARYAVWSWFGDVARHRAQRVLRPLGLLNAARRVKRALGGARSVGDGA